MIANMIIFTFIVSSCFSYRNEWTGIYVGFSFPFYTVSRIKVAFMSSHYNTWRDSLCILWGEALPGSC